MPRDELAARIPGLRQIVGFRNILIHGYAHVDNMQVWQSIDELPELGTVLIALLDELDASVRDEIGSASE